MKTKRIDSGTITVLAAILTAIFLAGCAEMEATNTKSLLSAAGFHVKTPQTSLQKEVYNAMPANHVERITYKGKVVYAYKDEKAGIAYVGHEPEYQRYKQLCIEQQVAQQYYMAAEMDRMYGYRWYGAWGPRYWY